MTPNDLQDDQNDPKTRRTQQPRDKTRQDRTKQEEPGEKHYSEKLVR